MAVFERRRRRKTKAALPQRADTSALEVELTKREIGPATAEQLAAGADEVHLQNMIELYDWYNAKGQKRGPGFLVSAIKNPDAISLPRGFESSAHREARKQAEQSRKTAERKLRAQREAERSAQASAREKPFLDFWNALTPDARQQFESEAVQQAEPTKRSGYFRSVGQDDKVFEHYRRVVLRDHFERTQAAALRK